MQPHWKHSYYYLPCWLAVRHNAGWQTASVQISALNQTAKLLCNMGVYRIYVPVKTYMHSREENTRTFVLCVCVQLFFFPYTALLVSTKWTHRYHQYLSHLATEDRSLLICGWSSYMALIGSFLTYHTCWHVYAQQSNWAIFRNELCNWCLVSFVENKIEDHLHDTTID